MIQLKSLDGLADYAGHNMGTRSLVHLRLENRVYELGVHLGRPSDELKFLLTYGDYRNRAYPLLDEW